MQLSATHLLEFETLQDTKDAFYPGRVILLMIVMMMATTTTTIMVMMMMIMAKIVLYSSPVMKVFFEKL